MESNVIIIGICSTIAAGAVLGFWGWVAIKIIQQGVCIADLEARMNSNDLIHTELTVWLRGMDTKLNTVCENVSGIRGALDYLVPESKKRSQEEKGEVKDDSEN